MAVFFESFCVAVLGFLLVNAALGGGGKVAAWRVAYAVAATLLVLVCGVVASLAWFGRGDVGLYAGALLGVALAVAVNAARVFGVFAWASQNRGRAALLAGALLIVGGVAFVGFGRSPDTLPVPLVGASGVPLAGAVDSSAAVCLCVSGGVCTGPRGGKYCTTDAGKKRYL